MRLHPLVQSVLVGLECRGARQLRGAQHVGVPGQPVEFFGLAEQLFVMGAEGDILQFQDDLETAAFASVVLIVRSWKSRPGTSVSSGALAAELEDEIRRETEL